MDSGQFADKASQNTVERCAQLADQGFVVVAATERLRHLATDHFNRIQADGAKRCWDSPEIYTWIGWLRHLWTSLEQVAGEPLPQLLTALQTEAIWEKCISEHVRRIGKDGFEYLLWHVNSTASTAQQAYRMMCGYEIDPESMATEFSEDVRNFLAWRQAYCRHLESENLIDTESVPGYIARFAGTIADEFGCDKVVLAEFCPLTPHQERLVRALQAHRIQVEVVVQQSADLDAAEFVRADFDTADQEIAACALWAREVIEQDPENHAVGIAVPNLRALQSRIRRNFSACTNPGDLLTDRQPQRFAFHITLGDRLSRMPLVADALNLVALISPQVETDTLCAVITSDRIKGWDTESAGRAGLAAELRSRCGQWAGIEDVLKLIGRARKGQLRQLHSVLSDALSLYSKAPDAAEMSFWARFFTQWMACFQSKSRSGRIFGSDEVLAHQQWGNIIEKLAELGFMGRKFHVGEALAKLRRVSVSMDFQPRAVQVPIQIGGPKALVGQRFTHLWIMGMNNDTVPGAPQPNPFVPISIQKQLNIPMASPALMRECVERELGALISSSNQAVLSFARTDGERSHDPSALLAGRPAGDIGLSSSDMHHGYQRTIAESGGALEQFRDWRGPSVADPESVRSGIRVLSDQSNCPFKAFAEHRLKVRSDSVDQGAPGFTALERGSVMHQMLHELLQGEWRDFSIRLDTKNSSVDRERFRHDSETIVRKLLFDANDLRLRPVSSDVLENEVQRLVAIALKWRLHECERFYEDRFEVHDTEFEVSTEIAGMPIRGRVDRLDKSLMGHLIIDYKSADRQIERLIGDSRIREAQLLVYAYALAEQGHQVSGMAYEAVSSEAVKYRQIDPPDGIDQFLRQSFVKLEFLAREYQRGIASLNPLVGACDYCAAAPVCRIGEMAEDERQDMQ